MSEVEKDIELLLSGATTDPVEVGFERGKQLASVRSSDSQAEIFMSGANFLDSAGVDPATGLHYLRGVVYGVKAKREDEE